MRETREKLMELCAQAANEQDSKKLMALIGQIISLLDAQQARRMEEDSKSLKSEPTDWRHSVPAQINPKNN
jgi:hypothetical protein